MHDVPTSGAGPIVMVDDSESDMFLAKECYERSRTSNDLICLESGEELLHYLHDVAAGKRPMPALVLMDISMPGVSGFDILMKIRQSPALSGGPPVKMLTSSDDPKDVARSKDLGADGYLTKPADVDGYVAMFDALGFEIR